MTTYYKSESQQFFLPLTEILNLLGISHEIKQDQLTITGSYLDPDQTYIFNFKKQFARYKDREIQLTASDYLIRELDYYVRPSLLDTLLELDFRIDFNSLSLSLNTKHTVPVIARRQRSRQRRRTLEKPRVQQEKYPLHFNRERSMLDGGFLDYNLNTNIGSGLNFFTYHTTFGAELLGGDIQGSAQGSRSRQITNFTTSNLRWRYVLRDNDWLTRIRVGQSSTNGLRSRRFTGIQVSNEPIEPRTSFDEHVIQGRVAPQSEVELYLNNSLIDFQQADELGNYRFVAPLTFGSSRFRLKVFGPNGGVRTIRQRIQIPFEFQQPGKFRYDASAGRLDQTLFGTSNRGYIAHSNISYGLSEKITLGGGFEYLEASPMNRPLFYNTLNTRLFTNQLVNLEVVPDAYYRIRTNAVYPSSAGWGIDYTYFTGNSIYNRSGLDHEINGNVFTPINIGDLQFNARLFARHRISGLSRLTRYRADLSTRVSRLTIRTGFDDQQIGTPGLRISSLGRATGSITYTLSRSNSIPGWIRGAYLRGQLNYRPETQSIERVSLELSRSISQTGRIRVSGGRNFSIQSNNLMLSFTYNFPSTRSTTTTRSDAGSYSFSQSFRGTVGFDSNNNRIIFDNRQQVGRGAASVRLFVDGDNDGAYDKGEKLISDNAVKLQQAGDSNVGPDGLVRLSQLRAYNRINADLQTSALSNPLYIPEIDTFSFVADPNQYKTLDIPFYQSGVVSGKVMRIQQGTQTAQPQSGIRIFIEGENDFHKEVRTFSDGSFYSMEIPPGNYTLFIDRSQLEFLNAVSEPDTLHISIENKAQGDFIENLEFTIKPRRDSTRNIE